MNHMGVAPIRSSTSWAILTCCKSFGFSQGKCWPSIKTCNIIATIWYEYNGVKRIVFVVFGDALQLERPDENKVAKSGPVGSP